MSEAVTITPQTGMDEYDNPSPAGTPFTLHALVAPGDTTKKYGADGNDDRVQFTVYLPLRLKISSRWVRTVTALTDNFLITVRGQTCLGRAKEWVEGSRGGVEVLASADTGTTV